MFLLVNPLSANAQHDQTHSNNSTNEQPTNFLNMFEQFVGLALEGVKEN